MLLKQLFKNMFSSLHLICCKLPISLTKYIDY